MLLMETALLVLPLALAAVTAGGAAALAMRAAGVAATMATTTRHSWLGT